jgi:hypothetical protein
MDGERVRANSFDQLVGKAAGLDAEIARIFMVQLTESEGMDGERVALWAALDQLNLSCSQQDTGQRPDWISTALCDLEQR